MPTAPLKLVGQMSNPARPCSTSDCYHLAPCPDHPVQPQGSRYGGAHRAWRDRVLALADYHCAYPDCTDRATDADHIMPISQGGARFDVANGQALCHQHHSMKTRAEGLSKRVRMNEQSTSEVRRTRKQHVAARSVTHVRIA